MNPPVYQKSGGRSRKRCRILDNIDTVARAFWIFLVLEEFCSKNGCVLRLIVQEVPMKERFWYTFFDVEWGYFGILAGDRGVYRTALPLGGSKTTQGDRLVGIIEAKHDRWLMKPLQERISAYFAGICVEFSDVGVCFDGVSDFGVRVLTACRKV